MEIDKTRNSEAKYEAVEVIRQEASIALAEFAERAFKEGYSMDDVLLMLHRAANIIRDRIPE